MLPFLAFFCNFMVSEDFFFISWRDRLYSVKMEACEYLWVVYFFLELTVCMWTKKCLVTFGMVLVQLIGCLLPVFNAVLKRSDEALHQSTERNGDRVMVSTREVLIQLQRNMNIQKETSSTLWRFHTMQNESFGLQRGLESEATIH